MITHFFGNYLLTNKLVSIEQLIDAIRIEKTTREKLGVLAIKAGYMKAPEVDKVHSIQMEMDKRFGEIAVDMGYLTSDQLDELLNNQRKGFPLLGEILINKEYITREVYERTIDFYEKQYKISDGDLSDLQNDKIKLVISDFYNFFGVDNKEIYIEYISLLFKNIIRFIGDDFTPLKLVAINEYKYNCVASQNSQGGFSAYSAIEGEEEVFVEFASRYSKEALSENDEYSHSAVGEFLNIHNGIFCSKIASQNKFKVQLEPQILVNKGTITGFETAFLIPVYFTFGIVNFIVSNNVPLVNCL